MPCMRNTFGLCQILPLLIKWNQTRLGPTLIDCPFPSLLNWAYRPSPLFSPSCLGIFCGMAIFIMSCVNHCGKASRGRKIFHLRPHLPHVSPAGRRAWGGWWLPSFLLADPMAREFLFSTSALRSELPLPTKNLPTPLARSSLKALDPPFLHAWFWWHPPLAPPLTTHPIMNPTAMALPSSSSVAQWLRISFWSYSRMA